MYIARTVCLRIQCYTINYIARFNNGDDIDVFALFRTFVWMCVVMKTGKCIDYKLHAASFISDSTTEIYCSPTNFFPLRQLYSAIL